MRHVAIQDLEIVSGADWKRTETAMNTYIINMHDVFKVFNVEPELLHAISN